MAKVTASEFLDKWGRRLNAAGPDITRGVQSVKTAPGQAAAAAADRMLAGVQRALSDGTWQRNVAKVSLQQWQDSMLKKGMGRIAAGVTSAQQNKVAEIQALLSAVDGAKSVVDQLPKGGLENSIQRATTWMREMSARAPKRQGG